MIDISGSVGTSIATASVQGPVPVRTLGDKKVAYDVLRQIPEESAEHYKLVPLAVADGVLEVGMLDPDNLDGIDALNFIARNTGIPFKVFQISEEVSFLPLNVSSELSPFFLILTNS